MKTSNTANQIGGLSQSTVEMLKDHLETWIEDMFDDPSFMIHPDETEPPSEFIAKIKKSAQELGVDWQEMVARASPYERERMSKLEQQTWSPSDHSRPNILRS